MKRREPLVPDMTPLIDVVFILLIFFIVTSVFKKEELALLLNLPKSQAQKLEVERENINIELSNDKLAFKGKEITLENLDKELSQIEDKERAVIVRIDEEVPYKKVVGILDLLQKYKLNKMALVTKSDDNGSM
ncbi:MAG: biopolymer transporter ExbD [Sulfurovum sp.]|nr:biopolymer transporter ExbD [Sulfurovum sp.]